MWAWCPQKPEEDTASRGTGVIDSSDPPFVLGTNSESSGRTSALNSEPSLQPYESTHKFICPTVLTPSEPCLQVSRPLVLPSSCHPKAMVWNTCRNGLLCQARWYTSVIPVLGSQRSKSSSATYDSIPGDPQFFSGLLRLQATHGTQTYTGRQHSYT